MYAQVEKPKENKRRAVANSVAQKRSSGEPTFQFVDNLPEAIAQRKLQEMANNTPQAKHSDQLQAMTDNYSARQPYHTQRKENKSSYFWGTARAVNEGTESFFRTLDNAAVTLS